ncbi:MAG: helix-turn-helix domain-containing protein [Acidobacteria bacterium]|nr:helix-turn-helix domain-containing protein [Acidobacteriota bacterium]MCA1639498.1 helix-turn-helix domain-containing protein [Acidobacteriota bacterium]
MIGTITKTKERIAISVDEASELSGLSKPLLRNHIRSEILPVVRPGNSRRVLIMMSDFMDYLKGENDETK